MALLVDSHTYGVELKPRHLWEWGVGGKRGLCLMMYRPHFHLSILTDRPGNPRKPFMLAVDWFLSSLEPNSPVCVCVCVRARARARERERERNREKEREREGGREGGRERERTM